MKPGRSGVELVDVRKAIEELEQEGTRPTLRAVRDRLGRGSMGTIQRHLAALRPHDSGTQQTMTEVPERIRNALGGWVQELVQAKLENLRGELDEQTRTILELSSDNEAMNAAYEGASSQIAELTRKLELASLDAAALQTANIELRQRVRMHEEQECVRAAEFARTSFRLEQLENVEVEASDLRRRVAECERHQAVSEAMRSGFETRLALTEERLIEKREQSKLLSESLVSTKADLESERQRRIAAESELDKENRLFEQLVRLVPDASQRLREHREAGCSSTGKEPVA